MSAALSRPVEHDVRRPLRGEQADLRPDAGQLLRYGPGPARHGRVRGAGGRYGVQLRHDPHLAGGRAPARRRSSSARSPWPGAGPRGRAARRASSRSSSARPCSATGAPTSATENVLRAVVGGGLYMGLIAIFSMGVAAMLRSSMLSLGILMPFFFLMSQILSRCRTPRTSPGTSPTRPGRRSCRSSRRRWAAIRRRTGRGAVSGSWRLGGGGGARRLPGPEEAGRVASDRPAPRDGRCIGLAGTVKAWLSS